MRSILFGTVAVVAMAASVSGASAGQWVAGVFGGGAFPQGDHEFSFVNGAGTEFPYGVSLENGFIVGAALGYDYNPNWRAEIEVAYSSNDFGDDYAAQPPGFVGLNETGSYDVVTVLINGWYSFAPIGTDLVPYLGGGIGVAFVDADLTVSNGAGRQLDGEDVAFAAQLGGGLRFGLGPDWDADLAYRFRGAWGVEIDSALAGFTTTDDDFYQHTLTIGFTHKF
jgi:opacity protein-like surface antigen